METAVLTRDEVRAKQRVEYYSRLLIVKQDCEPQFRCWRVRSFTTGGVFVGEEWFHSEDQVWMYIMSSDPTLRYYVRNMSKWGLCSWGPIQQLLDDNIFETVAQRRAALAVERAKLHASQQMMQ